MPVAREATGVKNSSDSGDDHSNLSDRSRRKFVHGAGLVGLGLATGGSLSTASSEHDGDAATESDDGTETDVETGAGAAAQLEDGWPKFQYDLGNTGFAATESGPDPPISLRWRFQTGGNVISSPSVVDGTAYVGSDDNNVYALDAETGEEQWRFETGHSIEYSSPSIADGTVYIGSWDHHVYALDAETGDEQWRFETGDYVRSSPAVVDGTVYIGGWDHHVYALDAETGDEQWRFDASDRMTSSPAVVDGTVYFGTFGAGDDVYALDAETGDERWRYQTSHRVDSSPAVADGLVYVASLDTHLYALDAASGDEQWRFETDNWIFSSPAVVDGAVYIGSRDSYVYAIDDGPAEPEATITFSDQESEGTTVVVDRVDLSHGGYVQINNASGTVCGRSTTLAAGTHENVAVSFSRALGSSRELTATVYLPSGEPYHEDGEAVSDSAWITVRRHGEDTDE